jgi:putative membrane protein
MSFVKYFPNHLQRRNGAGSRSSLLSGRSEIGTRFSGTVRYEPMTYKLIVVVALAALGALFIVQNVTVVEIRFLFWSITMSRSLLIIFLLALGIAIGWLLHGYLRFRQRKSDSDG